MSNAPISPWLARFLPLLDKDEIRRRAILSAVPISDLHTLPVEAASRALEDAMENVFHPTTQIVDVLHQLVSSAYGHCLQFYPDSKSYTANIYRQESPLSTFMFPTCLTGLAGVGKSRLARALERILPADGHVECPLESSKFPLRSMWKIDVQIRSSLKDIFAPLGGAEGSLGDQLKTARKRAYRDGVSLILADEFQFLTASASANTRITQTLLSLGYCGLPTVYVANYSLLYRLMRRPQEDRDRLLANVVVMSPDAPESEDWTNTLAALIATAPDVFRINPKTEGPQFHRYCAGIKRAAAHLLVVGFRLACLQRQGMGQVVVTMVHIQAAYRSTEYSTHRTDIEIITQQFILGRMVNKKRRELWCPLGHPASQQARLSQEMGRGRDLQLTDKIQTSAATETERVVLQAHTAQTSAGKSGSVIRLPRRKRPDAETLKANAESLRDL